MTYICFVGSMYASFVSLSTVDNSTLGTQSRGSLGLEFQRPECAFFLERGGKQQHYRGYQACSFNDFSDARAGASRAPKFVTARWRIGAAIPTKLPGASTFFSRRHVLRLPPIPRFQRPVSGNDVYEGVRMVANTSKTSSDSATGVGAELDRLVDLADPSHVDELRRDMDAFKELYQRWRDTGKEGRETVDWKRIGTPTVIPYDTIVEPNSAPFYGIASSDDLSDSSLDAYGMLNGSTENGVEAEDLDRAQAEQARVKEEDRALLDKLVVLKLNGGLGTTMGCQGPKSAIEVRNDMTFLDLTVRQIQGLNRAYGSRVPLVLMNSFNTDEETHKIITRYGRRIQVYTFKQKRFPRLIKETHMPVAATPSDGNFAWYPPGHGDVFDSFLRSDLFQKLRDAGKEYVFISNIDNLGATVDLNILRYMAQQQTCEFVMEVTDRTRSDVKGGTLIDYDGTLRLLEIAQVPHNRRDDFQNLRKFRIFNTNNMWCRMDAIEERRPELDLDIIVNVKNIPNFGHVVQLETAAGAAIRHFRDAAVVNVPRYRFLPVKNTSDLFVAQSNIYQLEHNCLRLSPKRVQLMGNASLPVVKLGDAFQNVTDYISRFGSIPDILELDHLTVSGDVTFGNNVVLKGTVIIVANFGSRIDIPSGSKLENKVVSGNLRIDDH